MADIAKNTRTLVLADAAFIKNLADGMNGQLAEVAEIKAALDAANGRLLPFLILALTGVSKVTEEDWSKDWAAPSMASYTASGRYKVDDRGVSLSARSAVSALKVCVIALTHGYEPKAGESLFTFTGFARETLKAKGLLKADKSGAKKTAQRASTVGKVATAEKMAHVAAFALAGKDQAFADKLALVAGDYREEFELWFDALMARQAKRLAA